MLTITIPSTELYDERINEFVTVKGQTLQLEHSLVSISKWESKWCKPFLTKTDKTAEEVLDYIRCMTLTQNVDPKIYKYLTKENIQQIKEYIEAPMTATTVNKPNSTKGKKEIVTSELIYYWMMSLQIYPECQKWHLNRLLKLIEVFNAKNASPKKTSQRDLAAEYAKINAARRSALNSKG